MRQRADIEVAESDSCCGGRTLTRRTLLALTVGVALSARTRQAEAAATPSTEVVGTSPTDNPPASAEATKLAVRYAKLTPTKPESTDWLWVVGVPIRVKGLLSSDDDGV